MNTLTRAALGYLGFTKHSSNGVWGRLVRGVSANAMGRIYASVTQLISVPVLISAWGAHEYGVWLMMATVPTYLALSDFGFSQAATAEMTMQIARGERRDAVSTFQSLWVLTLTTGAIVAISASVSLYFLSIYHETVPLIAGHLNTILFLVLYSVAAQCTRSLLSAFHSSGNYAFGTSIYDLFCFLEGLLVIFAAFLGARYLGCALILFASRTGAAFILYALLKRRVPWMKAGWQYCQPARLKRLFHPAIAAISIPLSMSINLQGTVLIVGLILSPAAVSTFSAVRTLGRIAVQLVSIVGRASMPELSGALAVRNIGGISNILRLNAMILGTILLPAALLFAFLGSTLVSLWSGGAIQPEASFVALMALSIVANAVWTLATQMLLAINHHTQVARLAIIVALATLGASVPAAESFGLIGVAFVLIGGDVVCSAVASKRLFNSFAHIKEKAR